MMRILALASTLLLAGCFNPFVSVPNPVSPTGLYEAEIVFDGSVKTFNELKGLCANRVLPRKCRTYVNQGREYVRKAWAADMAARKFVQENPTLDGTNVIQAFTGIVSSFNTTVDNLGALKQ